VNKNRILIFADHFQPGFKAGGPIQSLTNLTFLLKEFYEVYLISKNHDLKEESIPYPEIRAGCWEYSEKFGANLFYLDPAETSLEDYEILIKQVEPEYIYFNSMFSPKATINPLLSIVRSKLPGKIILAPRGELAPGALAIKPLKKKIYLLFFNIFLKNKIFKWHATSKEEAAVIKKRYPYTLVEQVSNLPFQAEVPKDVSERDEVLGDFVLISRIARIKNLDFALRVFREMKEPFSADIYGVIEDEAYWKEIQAQISSLPERASVCYRGEIKPVEVMQTLKKYRFYISPTKGENFGHSIFEAMLAGLPLVISDRTPWRNLNDKNIGWDISLEESASWLVQLNDCVKMREEEYEEMSQAASKYAEDYRKSRNTQAGYQKLFS
jgi:glycosyltransferase involved in cell wall biosynthesis